MALGPDVNVTFVSEPRLDVAGRLARPLLLLLLLAGFTLRALFLAGNIYHTDEFISMLAAQMVTQKGLPVLPSGLFYDHGLLYSFLAGGLVALVGFGEHIARWPALLVSLLSVAVYYMAGRRLFDSRLAGLLAAALAAFDAVSIEWGSWARMYSLAHLLVLLTVTWLLLSTLKAPDRYSRTLLLLFMAGMLFAHTVTFFALPPLALLLAGFSLAYRRDWLAGRGLAWQALLAAGLVGLALVVVSLGHVGSTVSIQDVDAGAPAPFGLEFLRGFFLPGLDGARFERLARFFLAPPYTWLLVLVGVALLPSLYRLWRGRAGFADVAFVFLALFAALVVLEMGGLLTRSWQKSRYMFMLVSPAFLLLGAESLARLLRLLAAGLSKWTGRGGAGAAAAVAGLALVAGLWSGPALDLVRRRSTGDFDTAFAFVRRQWQPGDAVMTEHPAAAYVYLGQSHYYANQATARVLAGEAEEDFLPVDRYVGSPLVDSVDTFNAALAAGRRVWFVVDDGHLRRRYDPFFRQQVFAQMDLVYQTGGRDVFLSRPFPTPLPARPAVAMAANFNNTIILDGYSLAPSAGGTLLLGLFWRPVGEPPGRPFKVFVQAANSQGETVAQADHFIYEDLLDARQWAEVRDRPDPWLRDSAELDLPAGSGPYRLYIGFYDPATLDRVPLVNDTSGQNAAVIELPGGSG